jgi:hypothetical protein
MRGNSHKIPAICFLGLASALARSQVAFEPIGPADVIWPLSVSGDGSTVIVSTNSGPVVVRGGITFALMGPGGSNHVPQIQLSYDGLSGTGWENTVANHYFLWRFDLPAIDIPGALFVGSPMIAPDGSRYYEGVRRWIQGSFWQPIAGLSGIVKPANNDIVAAYSNGQGGRWKPATGFQSIGSLPGGHPNSLLIQNISSDGNTIVGSSGTPYGPMAFRWTPDTGMMGLGYGPAGSSEAQGVSDDGSVIVGYAERPVYGLDPFIWTQSTGMIFLRDYLHQHGNFAVDGWLVISSPLWISGDAHAVVGMGVNPNQTNQMWRATLGNIGTPTVSGRIVFRGLDASASPPRQALVEFRNPATHGLVYQETGNVSLVGGFTVDSPRAKGPYDVSIKVTHWLRRSLPIDTSSGNVSGLSFRLVNGDCDGDNEVAIGDYAILSASFGHIRGDSSFLEAADLNGDDGVDIGDFAILSENFGRIGDD